MFAAAFRNLGQNLWGPHRYGCLNDVQVSCVVSGPCAAHSLLITTEGKLWSWGECMDFSQVKSDLIVNAGTFDRMCVGKLFSFICFPGRNEKGQLGHGDTKRLEAPKLIEGLADHLVVAAACGRNHTLALTGRLSKGVIRGTGGFNHSSNGNYYVSFLSLVPYLK